MFTAEKEELEQLGAEITTREIRQQPELWQETVTLYHENQTALENFLKEVCLQVLNSPMENSLKISLQSIKQF